MSNQPSSKTRLAPYRSPETFRERLRHLMRFLAGSYTSARQGKLF